MRPPLPKCWSVSKQKAAGSSPYRQLPYKGHDVLSGGQQNGTAILAREGRSIDFHLCDWRAKQCNRAAAAGVGKLNTVAARDCGSNIAVEISDGERGRVGGSAEAMLARGRQHRICILDRP